METKLLYSVEETAYELGLSRTRIFELIGKGQIDSVKIGRSRRIPRVAVESYISRLVSDQNNGDAA